MPILMESGMMSIGRGQGPTTEFSLESIPPNLASSPIEDEHEKPKKKPAKRTRKTFPKVVALK
jgi:hypothetical protein